jgi:hypothetical protein
VDRQRERNAGEEGCRVRGREEDVRTISCRRASEVHLFPPRTAAWRSARGKDSIIDGTRRELQGDRLRCVKQKAPGGCVFTRSPTDEEFSEIATDPGRGAQQLAGVHADAQQAHSLAPNRCSDEATPRLCMTASR